MIYFLNKCYILFWMKIFAYFYEFVKQSFFFKWLPWKVKRPLININAYARWQLWSLFFLPNIYIYVCMCVFSAFMTACNIYKYYSDECGKCIRVFRIKFENTRTHPYPIDNILYTIQKMTLRHCYACSSTPEYWIMYNHWHANRSVRIVIVLIWSFTVL